MRDKSTAFGELLETIADGGSVDWEAITARLDDERERRLARHLRLVSAVADVHRSTPAEDDESVVPSAVAITDEIDVRPCWGHLRLLNRIGEGTFGEVYRAHDTWLDREVALKLLKPGAAGGAAAARTLNEARTLARIRHPNVVMVHGADMHDARVGLWMEFVGGRTLSSVLALQGPLGASEATVIGQALCRALAAVHAAGLVHRDVKAQNVMREAGGRVVLMDFGAGQSLAASASETLRPAGTPLYLAPELLGGKPATVQTDIYALGVLLFYLVTGTYPVVAASVAQLEVAHACGERRRLRDKRPDAPDAFVATVERAIDPDPSRRFRTAGEMEAALATVIAGTDDPRAAVPPTVVERRQRRGWVAAATLATIALLTLLTGVVWRATGGGQTPAQGTVQILAVLPLQDLSGSDAYVADSMTEALTQELSTAGLLRVVSRTSVTRLVALHTPIPELTKTLKADAVVEGSVFRSGQDVRVNVRVIHAGTNVAVWASTFERASPDLPRLQQEIARAIASELRLALHPRTVERWQHPQPVIAEAYDEYLRGMYERHKQTQEGIQTALEHFQRAIAIDPQYARAHAAIAECDIRLGQELAAIPADEAARAARAEVVRALELDENLPDAHSVLAAIRFQFDWDFVAAEEQYRRAIDLDPSLIEARQEYADFLASRGRFEEAFQQLSLARELDPLSGSIANSMSRVLYFSRRYDKAVTELRRALQLEPQDVSMHVGLGRVFNAAGRPEDAIAEYTFAAAAFANHPFFEAEIAQAEVAVGRLADARRRVAQLRSRAANPSSQVALYTLVVAYARLDKDEAFRWLNQAFDVRSGRVLWVKVDPRLDPLRFDPRFATLLKRIQLAP